EWNAPRRSARGDRDVGHDAAEPLGPSGAFKRHEIEPRGYDRDHAMCRVRDAPAPVDPEYAEGTARSRRSTHSRLPDPAVPRDFGSERDPPGDEWPLHGA